MGKKLKSRQNIAENDIQKDTTQEQQPHMPHMTKIQLRKTILKKFNKQTNDYSQKHSKYFQKIEDGTICEIVNETQFQCPICLELIVKPTLMNCGHIYCFRCLESHSARNPTCCLCRTSHNETSYIGSPFAQNMINQVLVPRSKEIIKYLCRTTDTVEWIKRREIKNVKIGTILDFQDDNKIWRKAIVVKIFQGQKNQFMLNLKFFFKGNAIQQTIEASSKRLAPCNFFTRSKYLEQFSPVLPEYNLYQKELECLEYRSLKDEENQFNFNHNKQDECVQNEWLQHMERNSECLQQALVLFEWEMQGGEIVF